MKRRLMFFAMMTMLLLPLGAIAAPLQMTYQGSVDVGGEIFEGNAGFKFAVVDGTGETVWSNDGSSVDGSEPDASVSATVTDGYVAIVLGDDSMEALTQGLFDSEDLSLKVWFDDGTNGFQLLSPDIQITSSPFALNCNSIQGVELDDLMRVTTSITSAQIPAGMVTNQHIASGTIAASKMATGVLGNLAALNSPLAVANGGTGASNASDARGSLGLGSMAILNSPLGVGNGGTGATAAAEARTNLGLGNMAILSSPLGVSNGGTGATAAAAARTNLGLGDMAEQGASAVAITGGNINGTAIGVSATSSGNFSSLTTSGGLSVSDGVVSIGVVTPTSKLHVNGPIATKVTTVGTGMSPYGIVTSDSVILCNPASGSITLNLPNTNNCSGRMYIVKKMILSANACTLQRSGSDTIDGATSLALSSSTDKQGVMIVSDGGSPGTWHIVGHYKLP